MYNSKDFRTTLENTKNEIDKIHLLNKTGWEIKASYPQDTLEMAVKARNMSLKNRNKNGIACSYRNSGAAYYLLSQYSFALADLQKSLLLYSELEDKDAEATIIRNIGNVYHSMEQNEKSIECYFKALQITEQEKDLKGTAYNHGNIGYVFQKMGQYDQALEHMQKTNSLVNELGDTLGQADVLNNIGKVYFLQDKPEIAYPYFHQSLEKALSINHLRGIANAHCSLGDFYKNSKDFSKAIEHQEKALQSAQEMGEQLIVLDINKKFSAIYEEIGDYKTSLSYFKKYESIKNEILNRNNQLSITALQAQNDLERSEKEKEIYKQKNIELAKVKEEIEKANIELERLSIVASETENVVLIMDPEGQLEWVNASFERLNGITLADLKKLKGETIFEISNNPDIRNIIETCIKERKSHSYEALNITIDGRRIWESSTLTPIFDEHGQLKKLVIIDSDITERKLAEDTITKKNKEITDSINYARRIQQAILPASNIITSLFSDIFILYKPKDVVSGDFYTFIQRDGNIIVAAADCTGHGVPGAFMSMIGIEQLTKIIIENGITKPSEILNELHNGIRKALKQDGSEAETRDGMDIALCKINMQKSTLEYAGAMRPLWIVHGPNEEGQGKEKGLTALLTEIKGDKQAIGGRIEENRKPFTNHATGLKKHDNIYLFTDGFADQFGGERKKKFMLKNFEKLLLEISHLGMKEQHTILNERFESWKADNEQVDDVLVIGIKNLVSTRWTGVRSPLNVASRYS